MKLKTSFGFCKKSIPMLCVGMLLFSACKEDSKLSSRVDFDRKAMLENWYDNILMPSFDDFNKTAQNLNQDIVDFHNGPSLNQLTQVKSAFVESYKAFQRIKAFDAGPSESISLRASLNTYPADTVQIQYNINNNVMDLSSAQNIDAKGFPALDYLLYTVPDSFWLDNSASSILDHLLVISDDIRGLAQQNFDAWTAIREDFVNASGTDVGSSLGQLVNAINKDYELIKNAKIGFPAGKKTLGKVYPEASEAFFAQNLSMELAAINCEAIRNFYKGISFDGGQDGLSLQDYLFELGTQSLGQPLDQLIDDQLLDAITAIREIPSPFSDAVINAQDKVDAAYTAVQRNVISMKTDMPSAMGVLISYQDNDGD